jgi:biopolymer transport protein TolR
MAVILEEKRRNAFAVPRRTRPMSEINVTPLVDVMLVLLVIFMVTAPLLTTGVQVDLPATQAAPIQDQDEPVAVSVDRKGRIFLQDREVTLEALAQRLATIAGNNKEIRIFVRGDQTIDYGRIMSVVGTIHGAGFRKVALLTQPVEQGAAPGRQRAAMDPRPR